jgi:hypothetical protein
MRVLSAPELQRHGSIPQYRDKDLGPAPGFTDPKPAKRPRGSSGDKLQGVSKTTASRLVFAPTDPVGTPAGRS